LQAAAYKESRRRLSRNDGSDQGSADDKDVRVWKTTVTAEAV
jgi:hypothetical protein